MRVSTLDSSRETNRNELTQLRTEIAALRQTYISLENEKDTLLVSVEVCANGLQRSLTRLTLQNQLDNKTERLYKLEFEMKDYRQQRNMLEQTVKELQAQVE